jgi:hypothetical protein
MVAIGVTLKCEAKQNKRNELNERGREKKRYTENRHPKPLRSSGSGPMESALKIPSQESLARDRCHDINLVM